MSGEATLPLLHLWDPALAYPDPQILFLSFKEDGAGTSTQ